ncbi:MAG: hypothetical protein ACM32E_08275 [Gemmatimonadota bacterium]
MAARKKTAKRKAAKKRAPKRARKAAKKRVVKKRATRRAAPRKAAKKRTAKKRAARRAAPRKVAKKRAAKKRSARRAAPRKVAKKRTAKKRVVRKAAAPRWPRPARPAPAPAAFEPQKAEATAKELLLFELERARVTVIGAIQGLGSGTAMQPVAEGKWSPHEIVLHLSMRDRVRLDEFDSMLAGNAASWAGIDDPAVHAEMNERHLEPLRHLSWDEAVRLLMTTRAELVERLQALPAEPAELWTEAHPFGASMLRLPGHDRGHAEAIKNARLAG